MDQLKAMKIFCRVHELGSFSAAARDLAISRSAVSKSIFHLEQYLGIKLLNRSTRQLHFTEAGSEYYREATRLLSAHATLEEQMRRDKSQVKGLIRIGVPGPLIHRKLLPEIADFCTQYPDVSINFKISEHLADLYKDELDLVIRMGPLHDSSLGVIQLAELPFTLAASPDFISKQGEPQSPNDLEDFNCLCFRGSGRGSQWRFKQGNIKKTVNVNGQISADCGITLRDLAINGNGIIYIPKVLIEKELANNSLIPLLEDWEIQAFDTPPSIHILYHRDRMMPRRTRSFLDWLKSPERLIKKSL